MLALSGIARPVARLMCACRLAGVLLLTACESAWELDISVMVPVSVQEEYSEGYPAQLVLLIDRAPRSAPGSTGGVAQRIANLCDESGEPFAMDVHLSGGDCDAPGYVRVWLEPREEGAESKCGALEPPSVLEGVRKPGFDAPQADSMLFQDRCASGPGAMSLVVGGRRGTRADDPSD
ncbi:MAG: hypothetical protein ABW321_11180 [Polyangiales bacterium]